MVIGREIKHYSKLFSHTLSVSFHSVAVVPSQQLYQPQRWLCEAAPPGESLEKLRFLPAPADCEAPPILTKKPYGFLKIGS